MKKQDAPKLTDDIIKLDCATPDCQYQVKYDPGEIIPAFKINVEGQRVEELTCDNPETPHTNDYIIPETDGPEVEKINRAFWLKFAKDRVAGAIAARETAAEKIDAFLVIVWGIYTTAFAVAGAMDLIGNTFKERFIMALPVVIVPIARLLCVVVQLPVNVKLHSENVAIIRKEGYAAILKEKSKRLAWSLAATVLSTASIGFALLVFKTGLFDDKNYYVKADYLPQSKVVHIQGGVDTIRELKVAFARIDTGTKVWVYQEFDPPGNASGEKVDFIIPVNHKPDSLRVYMTWKDRKNKRQIVTY